MRPPTSLALAWAAIAAGIGCRGEPPKGSFAAAQRVFEKNCFICHSDAGKSGKLSLQSADSIRKGGTSGPAVVPGKPDQSLIVKRLRAMEGKPVMPQGGPQLPEEEIKTVEDWIAAGAKP